MIEAIAHTLILVAATEAEAEATSSGGIGAIGVDLKALLFQIANFAILFYLLKKFAFGPILRVLEDRRKTIVESINTAKELEKSQQKTETKQHQILAKARSEADKVLADAQSEASSITKLAEDKATAKTQKLIAEAQSKIEDNIATAKKELKGELLNIVANATEIVLQEKIDSSKDAHIIEKAILAQSRTNK